MEGTACLPCLTASIVLLLVAVLSPVGLLEKPRIDRLVDNSWTECLLVSVVALVFELIPLERPQSTDSQVRRTRDFVAGIFLSSTMYSFATMSNITTFVETPSVIQLIMHMILAKSYMLALNVLLWRSDTKDSVSDTADLQNLTLTGEQRIMYMMPKNTELV
ncbi:hypothetical protein B0H21DRAFT_30848 [Amylocystis lapponica]|nr:hypothetical protein B0H21DRAFT_30848 [Amylocystis lapponica]